MDETRLLSVSPETLASQLPTSTEIPGAELLVCLGGCACSGHVKGVTWGRVLHLRALHAEGRTMTCQYTYTIWYQSGANVSHIDGCTHSAERGVVAGV